MTRTETVMWTALPRGFTKPDDAGNQHLKLTVFVSPRLETSGPTGYLREFPDFASPTAGANWASLVARMSFDVETSNGKVPATTHRFSATVVSAAPDAHLWDSFFGPDMPTKQFQFVSVSSAALKSYSASSVYGTMKKQYRTIAATPSLAFKVPTVQQLVKLPGVTNPPLITVLPTEMMSSPGVRSVAAAGTTTQNPQFKKFQEFHTAFDVPDDFVPPPKPAIDFHKACTAIGNYPALNRRLGLAIDIEVPYVSAMAAAKLIRIRPTWPDGRSAKGTVADPAGGTFEFHDMTQWSAIELALGGRARKVTKFQSASRDGHVKDGYLVARSISNPSVDPAQLFNIDIDIAAARFMSTAIQAADLLDIRVNPARAAAVKASAAATPKSALSNEQLGLPGLGQAVIRYAIGGLSDRVAKQLDIYKQFEAHIANGTEDKNINYAEDLNRGYRIDVWDSATRHWHKLCARVGTYSIGETPIMWGADATYTDEGWIQLSGVSAPEDVLSDAPPSEMRIQEGLFDWSGWSLSVPRMGAALTEPDANGQTTTTKTFTDPEGHERPLGHYLHPDLPLDVLFAVEPGSLPRLRFGNTYRFRARSVDLAGNSVAFSAGTTTDDPGGTGDSDPLVSRAIVHKRFDPVKPPDVVMTEAAKPSESPYYLVVRTYTDPADGLSKTHGTARHLTPPRIAVSSAEALGGLDDQTDPDKPMDKTLWPTLRDRDNYDLPKDAHGNQIPQSTLPSPVRYLPDMFSRGAAFSGLLGVAKRVSTKALGPSAKISGVKVRITSKSTATSTSTRIGFDTPESPWYEKRPFMLNVAGIEAIDTRLAEHELPSLPEWAETSRVLSIELPKAEEITVGLSSYADGADLQHMGVYQWGLEEHIPALKLARTFFAGYTTAAVKKAKVTNAVPVKAKASLPAAANMLINTALIGQSWMLTPPLDLTLVHAVDKPLIVPEFTSRAHFERKPGETHATLVDWMNIHGKSTSKLDIKAKWIENVDDPSAGAPKWGATAVSKAAHVFTLTVDKALTRILEFGQKLPAMKNVAWGVVPKTGMLVNQAGLDTAPQRQFFGDTKHRKIDLTGVATTRFQKYFDDIAGATFTVESAAPVSLHVPSSARPARPEVKYVLPTFGWTRSGSTSTRGGGGLRVYLDRPWFSSGDEEQLAVVLYLPRSNDFGFDQLEPYTSKWGKDPLYVSPSLPSERLKLANFKHTAHTASFLQLREWSGSTVMVAAYDVDYDSETGLWFADVVIDQGSAYFPFVKLALARYQRYSLPGYELSPVVVADFVQLTPDRTATAVVVGGKSATVTVTGQTYLNNAAATRATVTISLERATGTGDAVTGWTPVTAETDMTVVTPTAIMVSDPRTTWRGSVGLLGLSTDYTYRIVVREYEWFSAYETSSKRKRLVYAEALPLTF